MGMKEQQQAALRRQDRLKTQSLNREKLSNIFGLCTMSEARKIREKIEEAGCTAENSAVLTILQPVLVLVAFSAEFFTRPMQSLD